MKDHDEWPTGSRRTFVVYDRVTGEILNVHHVTAATGAAPPGPAGLKRFLVDTAARDLGRSADGLGVVEHEHDQLDQTRVHVDVARREIVDGPPEV